MGLIHLDNDCYVLLAEVEEAVSLSLNPDLLSIDRFWKTVKERTECCCQY